MEANEAIIRSIRKKLGWRWLLHAYYKHSSEGRLHLILSRFTSTATIIVGTHGQFICISAVVFPINSDTAKFRQRIDLCDPNTTIDSITTAIINMYKLTKC